MIVLALDSTSPAGSVALWRGGAGLEVRPTSPLRGFSHQLPGALLDLLADHGMRPADVDVFAVAAGPGSLTGLRVGIATVQGLAFACDRRMVGVSTLEALAHASLDLEPPPAPGTWIGAWMNAYRGEVFGALYAVGAGPDAGAIGTVLEEREGPSVGAPEITASRWRAFVAGGPLWLVGDAVPMTRPMTGRVLGETVRLEPAPLLAGVVARLAAGRAARGQAIRPHAVHPLYVRRPDAEVARERAAADRPAPTADPVARRRLDA